jgi:hypothetical protein
MENLNRLNNRFPIASQFGNAPMSPIPVYTCSYISALFLCLSILLFVWPLPIWMNNVAPLSTLVKMKWYIYRVREWDYCWLRHQPEFILISICLKFSHILPKALFCPFFSDGGFGCCGYLVSLLLANWRALSVSYTLELHSIVLLWMQPLMLLHPWRLIHTRRT